jgi:signal transduction histidine kinase
MGSQDSSTAYLEELEQLFTHVELSDDARVVLSAARRRAAGVIEAGDGSPEARRAGLVHFTAAVLNGLWLERDWRPADTRALFEGIADFGALPVEYVAVSVALRTLTDPAILGLPPAMALDAELGMLSTFGPVTSVSVWTRGSEGALHCLAHTGSRPSRNASRLARRALDGETVSGLLQAVPVLRWGEADSALVARARAGARNQCMACLSEAASMIGPLLERQALLQESADRERAVVQAGERALVRLGLDLHDGPMQDLSAIGLELQAFRKRLSKVVAADEHQRDLLLGNIDELQARLTTLESGLRGLSRTLGVPAEAGRPFREAFQAELDAFRRDTGIATSVTMSGNFDELTASPRIALLRMLHEALTNVRQHGRASEVRVSATVRNSHVRARVEDNGRGFDVRRALSRRGERSTLGLAGMKARAELLGGSCDIRSAAGGPTVISFALPRWDATGTVLPDSGRSDSDLIPGRPKGARTHSHALAAVRGGPH